MRQPEFTDEAAKDLNDIHDYIGRDSPSAAWHFIQMVEERCDALAENPSLGRGRGATSAASPPAATRSSTSPGKTASRLSA